MASSLSRLSKKRLHVNIEGTFNVLEACVKHNVKKLIYSSSASVYGDAVELPMKEDHIYNNKTFYGATKIAGEHMCRSYYHRYGLDYAALRYMNVYGPRQDYKGTYIAVIMKILDRLDKGLPPVVYGDGSQTYDFIYVQDVAKANICALKSQATDAFFNVGSGTQTSIKELAEMILKVTGSDLKIHYEPAGQTFVTNRIGDPNAAINDMGFKYSVELEEGLNKLIEWRNSHIHEVPSVEKLLRFKCYAIKKKKYSNFNTNSRKRRIRSIRKHHSFWLDHTRTQS